VIEFIHRKRKKPSADHRKHPRRNAPPQTDPRICRSYRKLLHKTVKQLMSCPGKNKEEKSKLSLYCVKYPCYVVNVFLVLYDVCTMFFLSFVYSRSTGKVLRHCFLSPVQPHEGLSTNSYSKTMAAPAVLTRFFCFFSYKS
jgi:hypothetical protein